MYENICFKYLVFILLFGLLTPPSLHNMLVFFNDSIEIRLIDTIMISGGLFIFFVESRKPKPIFSFLLLTILAFLLILFNHINYISLHDAPPIYSTLNTIITIASVFIIFAQIRYNRIVYLFNIFRLCISINIGLAIFIILSDGSIIKLISNRASDDIVPFSMIGGGISTGTAMIYLYYIDFLFSEVKHVWKPIVFIVFLYLLDSRSNLVIGTVLVLYLEFKKLKLSHVIILITVISFFIINISNEQTIRRINNFSFDDNSSLMRTNALDVSISFIKENPLLGSGAGAIFPRVDKEKSSTFVTNSGNYSQVIDGLIIPTEPHSSLLLFYLEYGILGAVYLLAFLYVATNIRKSKKRNWILLYIFISSLAVSSFLKFDSKVFLVSLVSVILIKNNPRSSQLLLK